MAENWKKFLVVSALICAEEMAKGDYASVVSTAHFSIKSKKYFNN